MPSITISNPQRLPWVTKRFTLSATIDKMTEVRLSGTDGFRQIAIQSITNPGTLTHEGEADKVLDRTVGTDDFFDLAAGSPAVLDLAAGRAQTADDYVFYICSATASTEIQIICSGTSAS